MFYQFGKKYILNKTICSGGSCSPAPCRSALLAPTFPKQCGGWLLRVQPDGCSSLPSLLRLLKSQDQSPSNNRATWLDLQCWAVIPAPSHVSVELESVISLMNGTPFRNFTALGCCLVYLETRLQGTALNGGLSFTFIYDVVNDFAFHCCSHQWVIFDPFWLSRH